MLISPSMGTLYTDGSFLKKSGECGWAFILGLDNTFTSSCGYANLVESSYHAELTAIIEALKVVPAGSNIFLRCDHKAIGTRAVELSQRGYYSSKHCKKLWGEFIHYSRGINITYKHIKAHRHNMFNDYCDTMASYAIRHRLEYPLLRSFKTLSELLDFHCCAIRPGSHIA